MLWHTLWNGMYVQAVRRILFLQTHTHFTLFNHLKRKTFTWCIACFTLSKHPVDNSMQKRVPSSWWCAHKKCPVYWHQVGRFVVEANPVALDTNRSWFFWPECPGRLSVNCFSRQTRRLRCNTAFSRIRPGNRAMQLTNRWTSGCRSCLFIEGDDTTEWVNTGHSPALAATW